MPRMACTSRMDGRRWRLMRRSNAVAAVPLSALLPYSRSTTCSSSPTTRGRSATAIPRLRAPEEKETGDRRHDRPEYAPHPQGGLAHHRVTVGAVIHEVLAVQ